MSLRSIPSVDQLLLVCDDLIERYSRTLTLKAIRLVLAEIRAKLIKGEELPSQPVILARVEVLLNSWTEPTLRSVINATGVILHTNLGRAPLSNAAITAMDNISRDYSNLEFDIQTGTRGSRTFHVESVLKNLTGAEAGLVVNNCASAVLLVLSAIANRKSIIISRTQLVEIGGGFRIPDVMKQSGAKLIEVGTTNKVRLSDYEDALAAFPTKAALLMHAHQSNFKIIGFTEEPELKAVVDIAHDHGTYFIDDLGSGAMLDTSRFGMAHEPTVQESLSAGCDLVLFSGDKLLGGPQAGIIVGKASLITKIKKHPLARVVRADKTCLAGITATLLHYLKGEVESEIPAWRMISASLEHIKIRAENWKQEIGCGEVLASESTVGGGSLPGESIPTWVLALSVKSAETFLLRLRKNNPSIIARIQNDQVCFDPRTVFSEYESVFLESLKKLISTTRLK